ncbi:hypothetical protein DPMN_000548 [Dreissena polymorpha]|uniref:Uncharacterized protein n=1 Tax=Dreissena polymorpha TaxID=45954 RepID=A0A9D4MJ78_DREPO|nr:hypothetical protein DPMN_000548 [Dreissena polymorpha]
MPIIFHQAFIYYWYSTYLSKPVSVYDCRYYAQAVATATMTKDQATELYIRKRFSHIINGVGYIGRVCVFVNVCTFVVVVERLEYIGISSI